MVISQFATLRIYVSLNVQTENNFKNPVNNLILQVARLMNRRIRIPIINFIM